MTRVSHGRPIPEGNGSSMTRTRVCGRLAPRGTGPSRTAYNRQLQEEPAPAWSDLPAVDRLPQEPATAWPIFAVDRFLEELAPAWPDLMVDCFLWKPAPAELKREDPCLWSYSLPSEDDIRYHDDPSFSWTWQCSDPCDPSWNGPWRNILVPPSPGFTLLPPMWGPSWTFSQWWVNIRVPRSWWWPDDLHNWHVWAGTWLTLAGIQALLFSGIREHRHRILRRDRTGSCRRRLFLLPLPQVLLLRYIIFVHVPGDIIPWGTCNTIVFSGTHFKPSTSPAWRTHVYQNSL